MPVSTELLLAGTNLCILPMHKCTPRPAGCKRQAHQLPQRLFGVSGRALLTALVENWDITRELVLAVVKGNGRKKVPELVNALAGKVRAQDCRLRLGDRPALRGYGADFGSRCGAPFQPARAAILAGGFRRNPPFGVHDLGFKGATTPST